MTNQPICPCDGAPDERTIANAPAQSRIVYRVGDFRSFRHALLGTPPEPFDQEVQLKDWRPSATDDLGTQMLEWWAYLADILTFYNERIANESYLRTASQPENLRRLIRTLGYRPRPGVAAHGALAALVGGHQPVTLPKGFSVDSKPGPGEKPQTFELGAETIVRPAGSVPADPPAFAFAPDATRFLVAGSKPPFKAGARLLLESRNGAFSPLLLTVNAIATETAADGTVHSSVTFSTSGTVPTTARARDLLLLQATQTMPSLSISGGAIAGDTIHLAGMARDLHPGDFVLVTSSIKITHAYRHGHPIRHHIYPHLIAVSSIAETVWYANHATTPTDQPTAPTVPIVVTHSVITLADSLPTYWPTSLGNTTVGYGWRSAGQLLDQPVTSYGGGPLEARAPAVFPNGDAQSILIADAANAGMAGSGLSADGKNLTVGNLAPAATLKTPLTVHYNLLAVSRGKSVSSEVLGSGDARVPGQSFVLQKSPLTYLAKGDSASSTLRVWVDGREWTEVPSFYEQPRHAEIFVTKEDDEQKTHVMFGDGENGARLPTGANNVVASYRYGSGAKSPSAGTLTVIGKPYPNLKSLKNPVAVGGGGDPDPADKIRRLAPRSAMTFGRAISGDDYQVIAAQAPGVTRTQAVWSFDADEQRSAVKIYVGDDNAAVASAKAAIAATGDPHRHVVVAPATPITIVLQLRLLIDPRYQAPDLIAAATAALLDDDNGLFGARRLGVGEAVFNSQIDAVCLACEGVVAVHDIVFATYLWIHDEERHAPPEGAFFRLAPQNLLITAEVAQHDE
jgi:hypothetical protein